MIHWPVTWNARMVAGPPVDVYTQARLAGPVTVVQYVQWIIYPTDSRELGPWYVM